MKGIYPVKDFKAFALVTGKSGCRCIVRLLLCGLFLALGAAAQENSRITGAVIIEAADWFMASETAELPRLADYCWECPPRARIDFKKNRAERQETERFVYRLTVRNLSRQTIIAVIWQYNFFNPLTKQTLAVHEFTSREQIKPAERKTLVAFSALPPTPLLDTNLFQPERSNPYGEEAVIKLVIFAGNDNDRAACANRARR